MLDRIRDTVQAKQLPPAETRVAELVLKHPHTFVRTAVAALAQQASVSQPTVVRFCRSFGFRGLRDFKLKLAASLSIAPLHNSSPHPSVLAEDSLPDITAKLVGSAIQALQAVQTQLDTTTVEHVVSALLQSQRVLLIGVGQSSLVALDAQQKFFRFGLWAEAPADPALQVMSASQLTDKDMVVLISASGRSPELFNVLSIARAQKARVLAIGPPKSAHCKQADWCLSVSALDDPDVHLPMLNRLQHLMIIDVLAVAMAQRRGAAGRQQLGHVKAALQQRMQASKN